MTKRKVVITGAAGFLAGRLLPSFRERYDLKLLDIKTIDRDGNEVEGVHTVDLLDPNRDAYREHFAATDSRGALRVYASSIDGATPSGTSIERWRHPVSGSSGRSGWRCAF